MHKWFKSVSLLIPIIKLEAHIYKTASGAPYADPYYLKM